MAGDFASSSRSAQGNGRRSGAAAPLPTRYLERLVSHLTGCLSLLSPKARQLLTLRTGLSGGQPMSAPGAASALGMSPAQEAALEHRAVHSLRSDAGSGCAAAQVSGAALTLGALPAGNVIVTATEHPWSSAFPAMGTTSGSGATVASAVGAHHAGNSRAASTTAPGAPTVIQKAAISAPGSSGSASSWAIVALVLFGTLCGAALVLIQARRRGHSIWAAEGSSGAAGLAASAPIVSASTATVEPPATTSGPWTPFGTAFDEPPPAPAAPPGEWLPAYEPDPEPSQAPAQPQPPAPRPLRPSPLTAAPAGGRKPQRNIFKADPLPLALLVPVAGLVARLLSHARRTRRRRH